LSIDPQVSETDQPYVFTNDDPLNAEDPLGLAEIGIGNGANEFEVPDGYSNSEPEPEEGGNASDESQSIDKLLKSGEEQDPTDKGGKLTRAGRALDKASEIFGKITGSVADKNALGQAKLEEILNDPESTQSTMRGGNFKGGKVITSPSGISAVFSPSGDFEYFKWEVTP
jgi:hypothetical protein